MPDQLYLVVTLRRVVPDQEYGRALFDIIKQRLSDHPDVIVSGHLTNHFDLEGVPT